MTTIAETAQELITAAVALAAPTRVAALAPESTELLRVLGRVLRSYYMRAARVAPTYFGARVDQPLVAATGTLPAGWLRPTDAIRVLVLEATNTTQNAAAQMIGTGAKVLVVPMQDRGMAAGDPAVYELGGRYISAGNPSDPVSGALSVVYAARPVLPQALGDTIDATWPRDHNDLLILELAIYLARKDGRDADVAQFGEELTEAQSAFDDLLRTSSLNLTTRFIEPVEFVQRLAADDGAAT